jgi:hypothetical protein
MNLKTVIAGASLASGVSLALMGLGSGVANAAPPGPGDFRGPGGPRGDWGRPDRPDWRGHQPPWGEGPAPWGWGPPPPPPWQGPIPPPWASPPSPFQYFGQWVNPVFDPGFQQWGFWFFGIWIPL